MGGGGSGRFRGIAGWSQGRRRPWGLAPAVRSGWGIEGAPPSGGIVTIGTSSGLIAIAMDVRAWLPTAGSTAGPDRVGFRDSRVTASCWRSLGVGTSPPGVRGGERGSYEVAGAPARSTQPSTGVLLVGVRFDEPTTASIAREIFSPASADPPTSGWSVSKPVEGHRSRRVNGIRVGGEGGSRFRGIAAAPRWACRPDRIADVGFRRNGPSRLRESRPRCQRAASSLSPSLFQRAARSSRIFSRLAPIPFT